MATDADSDLLTYSLNAGTLPAGLHLNTDGSFNGTATYAAAGNYTVTVQVNDGQGGLATTVLGITVVNVNTTLVLDPIADRAELEDALVSFFATAHDTDLDPITFAANNLPPGISMNTATGEISGTLTTSGSYAVTISASDPGGNVVYTSFTWNVGNVNKAPVFSGAVNNTAQTIDEGKGLMPVSAGDLDGDALTYTILSGSLPTGISLNSNDGTFSGQASYASASASAPTSTYPVVIQADDGNGGKTMTTLTITVNNVDTAPTITPIPSRNNYIGNPAVLVVTANDVDGDTLTYSAIGLPVGIDINSATGALSGTFSVRGSFAITFTATDPAGNSASTSFVGNVINRAPSFTAVATNTTQTITEAGTLSALVATDDDADTLSYTLKSGSLPDGITLNTNGSFSGTASYTSASLLPYSVVVEANDGYGGITTTTLNITVHETNTSPTMAAITDRTEAAGTAVNFKVVASDPDGDTLTYTASGLPYFITINPVDGTISGTLISRGTYNVTITATDAKGNGVTQSFTWIVGNRAPEFSADLANTAQIINENSSLYAVTATDADGDALTYSLKSGSLPAGITFNPNGTFSGTAGNTSAAFSPYTVEIEVVDSNGGSDSTTLVITINDLDTIPVITALPNRTNIASVPVTVNVVATDLDGDLLTYRANGLPSGLAIDSNTGVISGTTTLPGTYNVTVYAEDPTRDSASTSFVWTITPLTLRGTITQFGSGKLINGAKVSLYDLSGQYIDSTYSDINGRYEIDELTPNQYNMEVEHLEYSMLMKTIAVYSSGVSDIVEQDAKLAKYQISLTANPSTIVGDGIETTTLTSLVKDENGIPAAGIVVNYTAASGTFLGVPSVTTDVNGKASIVLQSTKIVGVNAQKIPITATVSDIPRNLYAETQILMTFAPGALKGVVIDGTTNLPVAGASVTVFKDLDGDGITDFTATFVTGADGTYKIAIPLGDTTYDLEITKPVQIGSSQISMTFPQQGVVGVVTGAGFEEYTSVTTGAGIVTYKSPTGVKQLVTDTTNLRLNVLTVNTATGATTPSGLLGTISPTTGVFEIKNLVKGNTYRAEVMRLIGGQLLIVGYQDIVVSQDGEINLGDIELIDPYGVITDSVTNAVIPGATVNLWYANTARNLANGVIPNTLVNLPVLVGFAPSNNTNPQLSDLAGNYAYMVFPTTDYYITGSKAGYNNYTSPTIPVEWIIVKHDFKMTPVPVIPGGGGSEPEEVKPNLSVTVTADSPKYMENDEITLTIDYKNLIGTLTKDVKVTLTIPDYTQIVDANGGSISGNTIVWQIAQLTGFSADQRVVTLKVTALPEPSNTVTASVMIRPTTNLVLGQSSQTIMLLTNKLGNGVHKVYIVGYPDAEFKPFRSISRAEIAMIFYRIMELKADGTPVPYADVPVNHWSAEAITAVTKAGLMRGYEDGSFKPENPITRAELTQVIANFRGLSEVTSATSNFTDITGHWAYHAIVEANRNGIVMGYEDGTFRPQNAITRAEAVTMINGLLFRGPLNVPGQTFPDVAKDTWYFGEVEESAHTHEFTNNSDGSETLVRFLD